MKFLSSIKKLGLALMAFSLVFIGTNNVVFASEVNNISSGIYELENDVYHESETGMAMSRSYLQPKMTVEVRSESIIYTIAFSGSEYMENYRIKLNGEEVPVEILDENSEDGTVKLKVEVDKVDADMKALIYVGPMERDVEFSVIPKMDTLTLIEEIKEEVVTNSAVEETNEVDATTSASKDVMKKVISMSAVGLGLVVIVIGTFVIVKKKK